MQKARTFFVLTLSSRRTLKCAILTASQKQYLAWSLEAVTRHLDWHEDNRVEKKIAGGVNTVSAEGRAILGFSQHFSWCFPALIPPQSELIPTTQRSFICHFSHLNLFIPNFCRRTRVGIITQKPSYIPRGQHILPAVYCLLQLLGPVLCGTCGSTCWQGD